MSRCLAVFAAVMALWFLNTVGCAAEQRRVPQLDGPPWTLAGDPDLGPYTSPKQQPVDFALWQAGDGTWQLQSCIRATRCPGNTRLFYRWEGAHLTDRDWRPVGVAMEARPELGETTGGLQAPHVIKVDALYYMLYGDWKHICLATSRDGKRFERRINPDGRTAMFGEPNMLNTRDPMAIRIGGLWHCYYTAHTKEKGFDYCRTSPDLAADHWSESRLVAGGGRAGSGPYSAECPHVVELDGWYYLFRTQRYGANAQTSVYRSSDPLDFGVNDDGKFVGTLPVAAPELVRHDGQWYIAYLLPSLKGIQIAKLKWASEE
jgi:hypothetical protein